MPENNEFLDTVQREAEAVMVFGGVCPAVARDLARGLCERIRLNAGGDTAYIPSGRAVRRQRAIEAIDAGIDPSAVCRRFQITRRTLQRWINQCGDRSA